MSIDNMRILDLKVTDLKRIEFAHITPEGAVIEIAGKNGNGKSSLLDAIWWALGGKDAISSEPVRKGAEKAVIELDLGDIIVKRTIKPDRSGTITVRTPDGMEAKKPQDLLDKLVGMFSFDPLAFIRMPPAEQLDMLRAFAPDVDFRALDRAEEAAVVVRRDINRDVKGLEAVCAAYPAEVTIPDGVDVSALTAELTAMQRRNEAVRSAIAQHEADGRLIAERETNLTNIKERQLRLRNDLERLEQDGKALETEIAGMKEAHKVAPTPVTEDGAAINEQIREAQATNEARAAALAQADRAKADRDTLAAKKAEQDAADKKVTDIREQRAKALRAINLPVDGLSIGGTGITLNEHPLDQASGAEQLRVGIALAMKVNPKLRVIRVRDGALLDDESMELLRETAERENFQVWIERVGTGSESAVVIEAGRVKGAKPEATQAAE